MLADRIAAALVHHEPGWRLPRLTALARRYNVSVAEVDAAVDELAARHLLRRLPDGQVYRASPAEYLVPLEGLAGLSSSVDPMGGELTRLSSRVVSRRIPEDAARALQLAPGEAMLVIKSLWLVGSEPGAMSVTYLPARGEEPPAEDTGNGWPADIWDDVSGQAAQGTVAAGAMAAAEAVGLSRAIQLELGPPPPSVARSLRLSAGQPVATVTVRFDDPPAGTPVALSTVMLRPDLFRIVLQG